MTRIRLRRTVFLCLLILLQEFTHARYAAGFSINDGSQIMDDENGSKMSGDGTYASGNFIKTEDDDDDFGDDSGGGDDGDEDDGDDDFEQSANNPTEVATQETTSKRAAGWVLKLLKGVVFTSKAASWTTSLATLADSIYKAIKGCCSGQYKDACTKRDQVIEMKKEIEAVNKKSDSLKLAADNLQEWVLGGVRRYNDIVVELKKIANEQELLLKSLSPEVSTAINNATYHIKQLLYKQGNLTASIKKYMTVASMYETTIESVINIGFPLMILMGQGGYEMYRYSKRRKALQETNRLETETGIELDSPPRSNSRQTSEASLAEAIDQEDKPSFLKRLKDYKERVKVNHATAYRRAKLAAKAFGVATNFLTAGMNIYILITSNQQCSEIATSVRKAHDELTKAKPKFQKVLQNITETYAIINKSYIDLSNKFMSKTIRLLLLNITRMVDSAKPTPLMVNVSRDIKAYRDRIAQVVKDPKQTYYLAESMGIALSRIPWTLKCYRSKVDIISYVQTKCKDGSAPFDTLWTEAQDFFGKNKTVGCEKKVGPNHISKDALKKSLAGLAKKQGFSEACEANNNLLKLSTCLLKNGGRDVQNITLELKKLVKYPLTKAIVTILFNKCPTPPKKPSLTPKNKQTICKYRKKYKMPNWEIADDLQLDLNAVKAVKCS